jgi:hypothetical protein
LVDAFSNCVELFDRDPIHLEAILRVTASLAAVTDSAFDIAGTLLAIDLDDPFCNLTHLFLISATAKWLPDDALPSIAETAFSLIQTGDQVQFTMGCHVLKRLVFRGIELPDFLVPTLIDGCANCFSGDVYDVLAVQSHSSVSHALAGVFAVRLLDEIALDDDQDDALLEPHDCVFCSLLSCLTAFLVVPDVAIDPAVLSTLLGALLDFKVEAYLEDYAPLFRAVFALWRRADFAALCSCALEKWLTVWSSLDDSDGFTSDIVVALFGWFDCGWRATPPHFRRALLERLVGLPGLGDRWFGFAEDEAAFTTIVARLVQSLDDVDESLEAALVKLFAGRGGVAEVEVWLSLAVAGCRCSGIERVMMTISERNCLVSNYHRRLFVVAMNRSFAGTEQSVVDLVRTVCAGLPEDADVVEEVRRGGGFEMFDRETAPVGEVDIEGFVVVVLDLDAGEGDAFEV